MNPQATGPAENLAGVWLDETWKVERRLRRDYEATGETRSCGYKATTADGSRHAFVKAFDFRREEIAGDTDYLERMVREYNYERDVHRLCTTSTLSRVTKFLGAGKVLLDNEVVHYIICEWADNCLRELGPPGEVSVPLDHRFETLRMVASSIAQLHRAGIAHQDIKPSNVVCFSDARREHTKLTDLGSSSCAQLTPPPHDSEALTGQPNYAPYELLYQQPPLDWRTRRFGCDLFLLGNLCFTNFVGGSLTHLIMHVVPENLRFTCFTGNYYREVVPFLLDAHNEYIEAFLAHILPQELCMPVCKLVADLCDPEPESRGVVTGAGSSSHLVRLERIITRFDVLRRQSRMLKSVPA